ncbi:hypothetical protein XbrCFBP1976_17965 [Xanthomonas bromi]|uniref:Uncharacterized protein n=1 Tax=Xanthomonas bromi TaxID=56449 RepID=A0ABX5BKV8_9XANT|nr:hypothetical protein XbrCFBP1976_17965 [Xanthomonas bromi]
MAPRRCAQLFRGADALDRRRLRCNTAGAAAPSCKAAAYSNSPAHRTACCNPVPNVLCKTRKMHGTTQRAHHRLATESG